MITAAEARKKINELNTKIGKEEKELCEKTINAAIENCKNSCCIDQILSQPTIEWLRSLGYSVTVFSNQKDGSYTDICW